MKNKIIILLTILMFVFIPNVKAAGTTTISITPSSKTVLVGNSFTITVTVSSSGPMAALEYSIQYDPSVISLSSTTAGSGGAKNVEAFFNESTYKKSYTYTFKAKKSGSTTISVSGEKVLDTGQNEFRISKSTSRVTVMTQAQLEATYSKNNNLANLGIVDYELTPAFNKDVTEYSVTLKPETESINIYAIKEDNTSGVYGAGEVSVSEGLNQLKIQVTAQNGNIKIYTINATVEELDPIEIKVNDIPYTIVRKKKALEFNNPYFVENTTNVLGTEVPCFFNEVTNTTVVALKNQDGDVSYFVKEEDNYYPYREIKTGNISLLYLGTDNIPYNYIKKEATIGEYIYDVYVKDENSRFYLVYGINLANGNKGYYSYDNYEESLQRFDLDSLNKAKDNDLQTKKIELILGGAAIFFFIVLFIYFIVNNIRNSRKKKKYIEMKNKEDIQESKEDNKVEELIEQPKQDVEIIPEEETRRDDESITKVIESLKQEEKKQTSKKKTKEKIPSIDEEATRKDDESITEVIESLKQEEKKQTPKKRKNVK